MTQPTYTPLLIEGKYWLVKDAPDKPIASLYTSQQSYAGALTTYINILATCERIPTLPEHSAYWKSKEGVKMTENDFDTVKKPIGLSATPPHPTVTYAIPKNEDKDAWEEEIKKIIAQVAFEVNKKGVSGYSSSIDFANKWWAENKQNYTITKK